MTLTDVKELSQGQFDFDAFSRQNGDTYWLASELMRIGYSACKLSDGDKQG
jgi:hypothetical protein